MQKTTLYFSTLLLLFICSAANPAKATHYTGYVMTTECMNSCTIRVHARWYRHCGGSNGFNSQFSWTSTNPNCSSPSLLGSATTTTVMEASPICASLTPLCANHPTVGGAEEMYYYYDYDICGSPGCSYTMTWETCCRNPSMTSSGTNGMAVVNTIDFSAGCNNSPIFSRPEPMFVCVDQDFEYFVGGVDPDGDSLTYELMACLATSTTPLNYYGGFSGSSPMGPGWDVKLDSLSGILSIVSLTPIQYEVAPVCIKVNEFRAGQLIASTWRDMYITVTNCPYSTGNPDIGNPYNLSTGAVMSGADVVTACAGQPLCFDMDISDPDSGQVTRVWWQPEFTAMSAATFTDANNPAITDTIYGSPGTARFCWNNPVPGTYQLVLQSRDDACPYEQEQDRVITLVVGSSFQVPLITGAGVLNTCTSIPDTLIAPPGYPSYNWSTGATSSSIVVSNPGTYYLTMSTGTGCSWTDSFVVIPDTHPLIVGQVLAFNNLPLANEQVDLLRLNQADSTLIVLTTTTTDANGYYEFCQIPFDTVYVQARPDLNTAPGNMLTYADAAIFWNNSRALLRANLPDTVNFTCRPLYLSTASCTIGGTINNVATQGPQAGLRVILRLPPSTEALAWTTTDANGYFSMTNLASGTYTVSVDKPFVDEVNVPMVTITGQNCQQDSLRFDLHPTFLDWVLVGLDPGQLSWNVQVVPNPAADLVQLQIETGAIREMSIRLLDMQGRTLRHLVPLTQTIDHLNMQFNVSDLAIGMYFIEVQSDGQRQVEKLIVQR